jgi:hypothetical protein
MLRAGINLVSTGINLEFMDHNVFVQAVRRGLVINSNYNNYKDSGVSSAKDFVRLPVFIINMLIRA